MSGRGMMRAMAGVRCTVTPGRGQARRTSRRAFRGVHKRYLPLYGATYEAMVKTQGVTPKLIRRMCIRHLSAYASYT